MMSSDLRALVAGLNPDADVPVWPGPVERVDMPNRLITVFGPTGGPGLAFEGLFDRVTFQVKTRGRASSRIDDVGAADDALALLAPIDAGLLRIGNAHMVGRYVLVVDRAGGAPYVQQPDSGGRYTAVCNYVMTTSDL
jgi:hypothetical protein